MTSSVQPRLHGSEHSLTQPTSTSGQSTLLPSSVTTHRRLHPPPPPLYTAMPTSDPVDSGPDGSLPLSNTSPAVHADAPLPSTSTPSAIACACLNVQIAARVPDDLQDKLHAGPSALEHDAQHKVWLPPDAEKIVRITEQAAQTPLTASCTWTLLDSRTQRRTRTARTARTVKIARAIKTEIATRPRSRAGANA